MENVSISQKTIQNLLDSLFITFLATKCTSKNESYVEGGVWSEVLLVRTFALLSETTDISSASKESICAYFKTTVTFQLQLICYFSYSLLTTCHFKILYNNNKHVSNVQLQQLFSPTLYLLFVRTICHYGTNI